MLLVQGLLLGFEVSVGVFNWGFFAYDSLKVEKQIYFPNVSVSWGEKKKKKK